MANAIVHIDATATAFKSFRPGVGPFGEPQLVKLIAEYLNRIPVYSGQVRIRKTPDLLIEGSWAVEFKLARPFGDNGKEAEDWSVNLLHPYRGNVSCIGDCYKLACYSGPERRAICVIGYEHEPPVISLDPLILSFEAIAVHVAKMSLGSRIEEKRSGLRHPIHRVARVFAWEVLLSVTQ